MVIFCLVLVTEGLLPCLRKADACSLFAFFKIIYSLFIFTRCINRLCDLHIASSNFTEAGFTVLKHADLLEVITTDYRAVFK